MSKSNYAILNFLDDKTLKRFWSKVTTNPVNGCWEWRGARGKYGHGYFDIKHISCMAYRVSFFIFNSRLPRTDMEIMHECENASCVNPLHLKEGTAKENANYEGRIRKAQSQSHSTKSRMKISLSNSKLSDTEIVEIYYSELEIRKLAKKYKVGNSTIRRIKNKDGLRVQSLLGD